ncbi:hypothetical protein P872_12390 [Rhodonellum psychrophilum GCM71 = DSM 17998]|uniref:6-phosphogluconate dehydrogenase n=2 Tax=Rhodonellum TaxID=336827 RepID=U5BRG6_9BACT|nr:MULTISPECIES: hypothetical protein [Rhodonellum]ERM80488.1 hypothetical protein P872_12390 [Rhodonellum psychrophilum GCM71 = DSM 17998]SDZ07021.1 hypothetical protein SAMN05444412_105149 [Rhodonellum ikkaensis]
MNKYVKIGILVLVVVLTAVVYWRYFFVFSEGVKAGNLNYFEKKGFVFKTWEGRLVQEGFQSPTAGALQSNEFRFSSKSDEVANALERASGKFVELRYKEYLQPLPWRGASKYVVIEVLDVAGGKSTSQELPFD